MRRLGRVSIGTFGGTMMLAVTGAWVLLVVAIAGIWRLLTGASPDGTLLAGGIAAAVVIFMHLALLVALLHTD